MARRKKRNPLKRFLFWFVMIVLLVTIVPVIAYRYLPVPYTPLMLIRSLQGIETKPRHWLALKEMGLAPLAVLSTEDQRFFEHNGVDTLALSRAIQHNRTHRSLRGASTISQQTAKNVFLWPNRSWLRKGLELWFTGWIELFWPKPRILEVYLNLIEFGPGIYGIQSASQHWFGKAPKQLSAVQAASLAVILPSPLTANPTQLSGALRARRDWALRQMRNLR